MEIKKSFNEDLLELEIQMERLSKSITRTLERMKADREHIDCTDLKDEGKVIGVKQ